MDKRDALRCGILLNITTLLIKRFACLDEQRVQDYSRPKQVE
jgi:hypothetical protein